LLIRLEVYWVSALILPQRTVIVYDAEFCIAAALDIEIHDMIG